MCMLETVYSIFFFLNVGRHIMLWLPDPYQLIPTFFSLWTKLLDSFGYWTQLGVYYTDIRVVLILKRKVSCWLVTNEVGSLLSGGE